VCREQPEVEENLIWDNGLGS